MDNLLRNSAWLYDVDNRDNLHDDIPFYLEYAKQQQGEILELGCGTGRVALALAAEGFRVTGLDLSQQMLDVFRDKLVTKPELADRIKLVHGNMADFSFDRKFSMVIAPFRAFQALTDDRDIDNSLACIRWACASDGADCWPSMATAIKFWFLGLIKEISTAGVKPNRFSSIAFCRSGTSMVSRIYRCNDIPLSINEKPSRCGFPTTNA